MDLTPGRLTGPEAAAAAALRDPRLLALTATRDIGSLVDAAAHHGVAGLLLHRAARAGVPLGREWASLRERCARQLAASVVRDEESVRVLHHADRAGISVVVLKGLALAVTVYAQAWLRPRRDTDLLVRQADVPRLEAQFRGLGYALLPHVRGELTLPQRHYFREDSRGFRHAWDVHWRLTASQALGEALLEDDARARSVAAPLPGGVRLLGRADALLLSCIHRLAHHFDDPRLIWLWDIRLILEAMDPMEVEGFVRLADREGVAAACGRSLAVAHELAGLNVPAALQPLVARSSSGDRAAFLWSGSRRRITYLIGEWRATRPSRRVRVLRERLLPSLASMRERYPAVPLLLLPLAYPWRLVAAIPKWFGAR